MACEQRDSVQFADGEEEEKLGKKTGREACVIAHGMRRDEGVSYQQNVPEPWKGKI